MTERSEDLKSLRLKVRDLDDQILKLVADRLAVARAIGKIKADRQLPIKDYKVEKEVIERSRARARELGLYEALAEDVSRLLIKYAVTAQDEFHRERQSRRARQALKILVAGGRGRMGLWLSEFFDSFGHDVTHFDPDGAPAPYPTVASFAEGAAHHDVVVLSAPISKTAALIGELAKAKSKALIFDICSLKTPFLPALEAAAAQGLKIASAHPMFGPQVDMLAGRNILICHVQDQAATAATRGLFEGTTAEVLELPVRKHDELMSYVLGLSHLVNLVFAGVLAESGLTFRELASVSSTTFNAMLDVVRPVVAENQDLYYEIQAENGHAPDLIGRLVASVDAYAKSIKGKDRAAFKRLMEKGRNYVER